MVTAVYVHIPFCDYKCTFCDFATYTGQQRWISPYLAAVEREMQFYQQDLQQATISSVFFGGGTPTLLAPEEFSSILEQIGRLSPVPANAEITAESNPDTLNPDFLRKLRSAGVNRLSIGVQSLNDQILAAVNRRHTAAQAIAALHAAREAGFSSVSADLIFGLPGQSLPDWNATLTATLACNPDHLSLYGLIVEAGALLQHQLNHGQAHLPEDDDAAQMYESARERLELAGYVHYEISNWARPGHQSRHNLVYWQHERYLGLGLSAHSYLQDRRFSNVRGLRHYLTRLQQGRSPVLHTEAISPERARADAAMVGLRMTAGLKLDDFDRRFGASLLDDHREAVDRLSNLELLEVVDGFLRLTPKGYLLANQVWAEFI